MPAVPGAPAPGESLRTLKGLAGYACRHTGSCCRAGWPIPIEPAPLAVIHAADVRGHVSQLARGAWQTDGIICHTPDNECVFHAPEHAKPGCRLEASLGSEAMPFSCRQFPRILLRDQRGWHLSLSAWCGTAAQIIAAGHPADGLPSSHQHNFLSFDHIRADTRIHVEALDALDAWPPLLRPRVLAGHDAYATWETRVLIDCLAQANLNGIGLGPSLARALCWTERIRAWNTADGSLDVLVAKPFAPRDAAWLHFWRTPDSSGIRQVLAALMAMVPAPWQVPHWPAGLTDEDLSGPPISRIQAELALARYLGTRLVASWVAYQGQGLRSVLASLVSSYALAVLALHCHPARVVTFGRLTSALRASDWLQLHLLDRQQWADWCSAWERRDDAADLVSIVADADGLLDSLSWA